MNLVHYFNLCADRHLRIRFWFKDTNWDGEAITYYVNEVFSDKTGSLVGLGLSVNIEDDNGWMYYHWGHDVKFAYSKDDQAAID